MTRPNIYVTRHLPAPGPELLAATCEAEWWTGDGPPPREVLLSQVRGRDGLLCMLTDRIDEELLAAAGPQLRVVSSHAAGFDNLDLAAATRRGILVTHTPDVLTEATADLAFGLLLAAARRFREGEVIARESRWRAWDPCLLLGQEVYGACLGLVGFGRIGQAVARRAQGFGMTVGWYDPSATSRAVHDHSGSDGAPQRCETLDELLVRADFLSLHVPLTPATHRLIDRTALARLKPTAVLINTSRGSVVDTAALLDALREGRLAAAGLDVTDPEPLPPGHPLLQQPNCLILPHLGSASVATRGRMASLAVENLLAGLRGERPRHLLNPEVLGRG